MVNTIHRNSELCVQREHDGADAIVSFQRTDGNQDNIVISTTVQTPWNGVMNKMLAEINVALQDEKVVRTRHVVQG